MSENTIDRIGNFFHIGYTENERKRDQYDKLYEYLKSKEQKLRGDIQHVESAKREYESQSKGLPLGKIPAREFEDKRLQKDDILSGVMIYFQQSLSDVEHAKNKAYNKYSEYKAKAEAEDRAASAGFK